MTMFQGPSNSPSPRDAGLPVGVIAAPEMIDRMAELGGEMASLRGKEQRIALLVEAAVLLSKYDNPFHTPDKALTLLRDLGAKIVATCRSESASAHAAHLNEVLFEHEKFKVPHLEDKNPDNLIFTKTLHNRNCSAPLMAMIYHAVADTAGMNPTTKLLAFDGSAAAPERFVVSVEGTAAPMLLDPAGWGRLIDRDEIDATARRAGIPEEDALKEIDLRQWLLIIGRDMINDAVSRKEARRAGFLTELLIPVFPERDKFLLEMGSCLYAIGQTKAAIPFIRHYYQANPFDQSVADFLNQIDNNAA